VKVGYELTSSLLQQAGRPLFHHMEMKWAPTKHHFI